MTRPHPATGSGTGPDTGMDIAVDIAALQRLGERLQQVVRAVGATRASLLHTVSNAPAGRPTGIAEFDRLLGDLLAATHLDPRGVLGAVGQLGDDVDADIGDLIGTIRSYADSEDARSNRLGRAGGAR